MLTDAVLVDRVIAGFDDAFDELYRRHANAAWRVAQAVAGNAHDAADAVSEAFARVLQAVKAGRLTDGDAFKPYLLTATRNAALDGLRRVGKTRPTEPEQLDGPSGAAAAIDTVTGHEDAVLVAEAFRNLPERWRSVLWLTEVEGIATKDAAAQLGLTANGTAQLAVRARAGLRDRYLQAHVRNHAKPECRFTVEHLGAYVGGGLAPRDLAKVDQHLAGCEDCRARKAELDDMGGTLRRIVLPLPLGLAAVSAAKVHAALASTSVPATSGLARVVQLAKEPTPFMRRVVGASAAGVLTLGLLSLGVIDRHDNQAVKGLALPKQPARAASIDLPVATIPTPLDSTFGSLSLPAPVPAAPPAPTDTPPPAAPPPAAPAAAPAAEPPSSPAPAATQPDTPLPGGVCALAPVLCQVVAPPQSQSTTPGTPAVAVGANVDGTGTGAAVTTDPAPSAGATVGGTSVGTPAPTPTDPNTVSVTAPVVGTVTLP